MEKKNVMVLSGSARVMNERIAVLLERYSIGILIGIPPEEQIVLPDELVPTVYMQLLDVPEEHENIDSIVKQFKTYCLPIGVLYIEASYANATLLNLIDRVASALETGYTRI